jgi:hypothetical protein
MSSVPIRLIIRRKVRRRPTKAVRSPVSVLTVSIVFSFLIGLPRLLPRAAANQSGALEFRAQADRSFLQRRCLAFRARVRFITTAGSRLREQLVAAAPEISSNCSRSRDINGAKSSSETSQTINLRSKDAERRTSDKDQTQTNAMFAPLLLAPISGPNCMDRPCVASRNVSDGGIGLALLYPASE